jgi:hypothetical protein
MKRLASHYSSLGVDVLFKYHPTLEEYLGQEYDDDLISRVRPPSATFISPTQTC